jgi:hypothetical protein
MTKSRSGLLKRKPRAHLLVIECDAERLARAGMDIGSGFGQRMKDAFPTKGIVVVRTSTEEKLRQDLAAAREKHGRFRSILIIGHSNETGLFMLNDNVLYRWDVVGNWLQTFEPEFCFLVACKAGRSTAIRKLFAPIESLKQIYASPTTISAQQTVPLAVIIAKLLRDGRIAEDLSDAFRLLNVAVTAGQLYRWKRADTAPGQEINCALADVGATMLDLFLKRLFEQNRIPERQ